MCLWKLETELSWLEEKIMHLSSGVTGAWCQKLDVGQKKNKSHISMLVVGIFRRLCRRHSRNQSARLMPRRHSRRTRACFPLAWRPVRQTSMMTRSLCGSSSLCVPLSSLFLASSSSSYWFGNCNSLRPWLYHHVKLALFSDFCSPVCHFVS